jgi:hypothetical protein
MQTRDWLVYPWQIEAQVARWQARFPALLRVDTEEQYTRHRLFALTVSDPAVPAGGKRRALFFVPHAHEPAGTAACMGFVHQLLTGHHLDGCPSTLQREVLLREAVLTFIPDGNPYGRARCPEPWWDGRRYNNREFINMVFGIGEVHSEDPLKPRWERFKRVESFDVAEEAPARIGLVYEQVSASGYIEPNRGDPRGALARLIARLTAEAPYDLALGLHQTEFEGAPDGQDCMIIVPELLAELAAPRQAETRALAGAILEAWRGVGGHPRPLEERAARRLRLHAQSSRIAWEELMRAGAFLTIEIMNNSPTVPAEQQLLLADAALWSSLEWALAQR